MTLRKESVAAEIKRLELDTHAARAWAQNGQVEAWVHKYLLSGTGGATNAPFSDSLKREQRWWREPLEVELAEVSPAVGTDPSMEYQVTEAYWVARTTPFAKSFTDLQSLPPLITEYRSGELSLRDGNTRFETMRRLGWPKCWIIIWHNTEADFLEHGLLLGPQAS